MNYENQKILPFPVFVALAFSACTPVIVTPSEAEVAPNAEMNPPEVLSDPESGQVITDKSVRSSDEVRLLINSVHQYCLQYPAEYDVFFPNESEMMMVKRYVLSISKPSVSITVEPAGDVTLEGAADQIAGVEVIRQPLTIGGEAAIMPGRPIGSGPQPAGRDTTQWSFVQPVPPPNEQKPARAVRPGGNTVQYGHWVLQLPSGHQHVSRLPGAMISGWVWHDQCDLGKDVQPRACNDSIRLAEGSTSTTDLS